MSEQEPESTPETTGDTNVEADQVVVNNAPDGGGVDNNAPADTPDDTPDGGDATE